MAPSSSEESPGSSAIAFCGVALADHASLIFLLSFQSSLMFFSKSKSHIATVPLTELTAGCPSGPWMVPVLLLGCCLCLPPLAVGHLQNPISDQSQSRAEGPPQAYVCHHSHHPPRTSNHEGLLGSSHCSDHFMCALILSIHTALWDLKLTTTTTTTKISSFPNVAVPGT